MSKASKLLVNAIKIVTTIGTLAIMDLGLRATYNKGKIDGEAKTLNDLNALENRGSGLASAYLTKIGQDLKDDCADVKLTVIDEYCDNSKKKISLFSKALRTVELKEIEKAFSGKEISHTQINILHQNSLDFIIDLCKKQNRKIFELVLDSTELDLTILYELACKSNVLLEIDDYKRYWVVGYPNDVRNFIQTFWGSYNLMAMETGKRGLSVDSFTSDNLH